ncbi:MAG: sodium:proton antiporter [Gammaproteobacteria bacterium]|nr:sodium:proton antiporter [Gammaproteobacteria bacterium]
MNLYLLYNLISAILVAAVIIGYINHRFLKLHTTVAVTGGALLISLAIVAIGKLGGINFEHHLESMLRNIPFHILVLRGMLSFLLFAGALRININELKKQVVEISSLAIFGVLASTAIIGAILYFALPLLKIKISLIYCLLFGALISPTDPVAVLALFRNTNAPKQLKTMIEGEALFNDGVAIVVFLTIYQLVFTSTPINFDTASILFLRQTIGGIVYGAGLGYLAYRLLKKTNDYILAILITLVITTAGYNFAIHLDISGPLAMVMAGIFIGNKGMTLSMPKKIIDTLDTFWELIESVLNVILFSLIGLELLTINFTPTLGTIAALIIIIVIATRLVTVAIPIKLFRRYKKIPNGAIRILTWGGLRGALALALALSLPASPHRSLILSMTYVVVIFSIVVQGLTIKSVASSIAERKQSHP